MKKNPHSQSGLFNPRITAAFALCSVGFFLAALGFAAPPTPAGWSLITSPNPNATNNPLSSVTCVSANDCWAVGGSNLALHWNGTSWSVVAMPSANGAVLNSVACASSSQCWAVGYVQNGSLYQTIIEQWNGTSWSIISSPNPGTQYNFLYSVTCSTAECWAVGYYKNTGSLAQTLILRSNGALWAAFSSPNYPNLPASNVLNGVTCSSASDCWAVGGWDDGESGDSLFEHWNGTTWSISTAFTSTGIGFTSVACASSSDCWAITTAGDQFGNPFSEHWNGTSWTIVPLPLPPSNPPDQSYVTYAVTCVSGSECWAVGTYGNGVVARTLIERWDGASWSVVTSPNNGTQINSLFGVACASASQCWAVGYYVNGNNFLSLIAEYAPTIPPLTSIGSRKVHGSTPFDVDLLNASTGIECRSPGATGTPGVDYKIVFTFVNNLANCGTANSGSLSNGPNLNQCTVDLTGVANQQYTTVTLNNVLDLQNNTGNVSGTMAVLLGDTTADRSVNSADIGQTKSQSGHAVTSSNFREDVTVDGSIDSADIGLVKSKSGTALPSLP